MDDEVWRVARAHESCFGTHAEGAYSSGADEELACHALRLKLARKLLSPLFFNGLAITSHNAFDQLLPSPDGTAACMFLRTSIIGIPTFAGGPTGKDAIKMARHFSPQRPLSRAYAVWQIDRLSEDGSSMIAVVC